MFVFLHTSKLLLNNVNQLVMKQPELGIRINEIRNQKGITQKELSETSGVDIRTIQRIESGEVAPRISTLRLITHALSFDAAFLNEAEKDGNHSLSPEILTVLFITGIFNFISSVLLSPLIPPNNFLPSIFLLTASVFIIAGVLLYYGFYQLGKLYKNPVLQAASIIFMVCIPLLMFTLFAMSEYSFAKHINQIIIILIGMNDILFGTGLIKVKSHLTDLYRITGILHIIIAPFVVIPVSVVNIIGWWLILLSILLQLSIVYLEYKKARHEQQNPDVVP